MSHTLRTKSGVRFHYDSDCRGDVSFYYDGRQVSIPFRSVIELVLVVFLKPSVTRMIEDFYLDYLLEEQP